MTIQKLVQQEGPDNARKLLSELTYAIRSAPIPDHETICTETEERCIDILTQTIEDAIYDQRGKL